MLNDIPPFNIELLLPLGSEQIKNLRQIKVLDTMVGMTKTFHPDGLYSTEIFGRVGDARRSRNFAYIDLHIGIFHPVYYKAMTDLKELYANIINGKEYAIFDHTLKDFVKSDIINGNTGFKFFLDHFNELKFIERDSAKRTFNIKLVDKYKKNPLFDKLLVLPAGLRDYTIDENGKPSEDEINTLYRRVLGISNVIENVIVSNNEEYLDNIRYNLQQVVNQIYDYIKNLLEGKGKLIQGKWVSRNIDNSTRNVITPYINQIKQRNDPQFVSATQHVVGLYQFLRTIFPKSAQLVRDGILSDVFTGPNSPTRIIETKTLKLVTVDLDPSYYDEWMTMDGLEKHFNRFKIKDIRHEPIMIGPYYLGLMYNGPDNTYKFVQDINDIPKERDKKDVHPITYAELFYLSVFQIAPSIPGTITRYPITGYGSIYPSYNYLKSTVKGLVKHELNDQWQLSGITAPEYPNYNDYFYDSLSPSSNHIRRLGADYDGDTCTLTCYISEEAKDEFKKLMNSKDYYVAVDGSIAFSSNNDIIELVLGNLA